MAKITEILEFLDSKAPMIGKVPTDNVGLLVGDGSKYVEKIMISLDITSEVIDEAIKFGAGLIVSHHPVIRNGLMNITPENCEVVFKLLDNKLAAICMHTNLDAVNGGVNTELAKIAGLINADTVLDENNIGRVGNLPSPMKMSEYLPKIKVALRANGLRYYDAGVMVSRVAVGGGSGTKYCDAKLVKELGFDTLLSSDFGHHVWVEAKRIGLNIIDAGHYCTENIVVPVLYNWLSEQFKDVKFKISESHTQIDKFC